MTIGEMAKSMLLKLEWFDTRFPRIPVNVQVKYFFVYKSKRSFYKQFPQHILKITLYAFIYLEANRCATKPEKEPM